MEAGEPTGEGVELESRVAVGMDVCVAVRVPMVGRITGAPARTSAVASPDEQLLSRPARKR